MRAVSQRSSYRAERLEPRRLLAGLTGQYFDRVDFTELKLERTDATVDFNWGTTAPAAGMGANYFSVRWLGQVEPQHSEDHTFYVNSDDGVRLWVDGRLLIDNWVVQPATEKSASIALEAGRRYDIRLDYHDDNFGALARLFWSSPSQPKQVIPSSRLFPSPTGLKATYYDNADFTGRAIERTDSTIDFNWSLASPDPEIGADTFSARWSGQLVPQHTQTYRFFLSTDADAVARLRVDGMVIVDNTSVQDLGEIALEAGKRYDLLLEFTETAGPANVKLEWSSPSQAKQVIPSSRLFAADATAIPLRRADYTNPVYNNDRPDPGVIYANGAYWMVHTTGGPNTGWPLYRSTDMTSWTLQSHLLNSTNKPAFMTSAFWAPEIHKIGSQYVITGTAHSTTYGHLVVALGTASEITGPYTVQATPIVDDIVSTLDSNLFVDHDGRVYLLWKRDSNSGSGVNGSIRIREMNSTGTAFAPGSTETLILNNSVGGWERNLAEGALDDPPRGFLLPLLQQRTI